MKGHVTALGLTVMLGMFSAQAETVSSTTKKTDPDASTMKNSLTTITKQDRSLSKQWGLKESDWLKYKRIMAGPRGTWSPDIDPITALGVEESNPKERKRYATLYLSMEAKRVQKELAFEVAVQDVAKDMFRGIPVIGEFKDATPIKTTSSVSKRVLYFVDVKCKEECKNKFRSLRESSSGTGIDIFFKKGATDKLMGEWAQYMGISTSDVKRKRLTLNYDRGTSKRFGVDISRLPAVKVINAKNRQVLTSYYQ